MLNNKILLFLIGLLFLGNNAFAVTIEDDLLGTEINSSLWGQSATNGIGVITPTEQGIVFTLNRVVYPGPFDFSSGIGSTCSYSGNYDVQVDFELLSWPIQNGLRVGVGSRDGAVERVSGDWNVVIGTDEVYLTHFPAADGIYVLRPNTSDVVGKLRMQRVGSTLTGYKWQDANWIPIHSAQLPPLSPRDGGLGFSMWGHLRTPGGTARFKNIKISADSLSCPNNLPPIVDAGPDQVVNEETTVILDGSGSRDPDGKPLTYQWVQISGPQVSLDLTDPVHPTFTAPTVSLGGTTLTFQLTVSDGQFITSPDIVNISVKNVNHAPDPDAGTDQTVAEGTTVQLDASKSYDSDGDSLVYNWIQTAGPSVVLSSTSTVKPTFISPLVGSAGATLTFELSVSDGIDRSVDTVNIFVENVNHAPIANAGADQTKNEGSLISLDGSTSHDPDLDILTYKWTQVSGKLVELSASNTPTPMFTAPLTGLGGEALVFELVVNDGLADSIPDQVTVNILNVNDPPACDHAAVIPAVIWPPNHKMVPINISGVSDPDNDNVRLTVTRVTQDEPTNGLGDGDTSPDATLQGSGVLLRAERAGNGNGRVYLVHFSADDGQGGVCNGLVKVIIPHNSKNGDSAIDDGQIYESTQP